MLIRFRTDSNLFELKRLKTKTKVFYDYIKGAQYADDIAVKSGTAHGLQTLLTCYSDASKRFGLKVNAKKTEAMCLGPESDFFVDDIKLKNVDRLKYPGSFVNQACNFENRDHGQYSSNITSLLQSQATCLWQPRPINQHQN